VSSLLDRGADINAKDEVIYSSILYLRAHAMTLISQPYCYHPYVYFGASVLQLGMAPLHCAVKDGNVEMTTLLLERGANIKAKDKVCD
jgi:hypothetical protein